MVFAMFFSMGIVAHAQEELMKYGDFERWITREVKESVLVGGKLRTLYEIGPTQTWPRNTAYKNQGGSPWGTSNVYAKVAGVVKSNESVYPDVHKGGKCAKLESHVVKCKAIGIVNITVFAAGSIFAGETIEPITGSSNPMSKIDAGIPFTKRPKALKLDYKIKLSDSPTRIRETGFGRTKTIEGKDYCEVLMLLQKRWEDSDGKIHAKRVGTMWHRFTHNSEWKEGQTFNIHYGDITKTSYYKDFMQLQNDGAPRVYYSRNSEGDNEMIHEEGWADADETPTHMILFFNASHGGAYIGSPGNTMWIDNVKLVY